MPNNNNKRKNNNKRNRNNRGGRLPQMTTAIPRGPEGLMDGKTFTFNQFVPVTFPQAIPLGESVIIQMNCSPNGYDYQVSSASSTPFTFGEYWGEQLQQFQPLSLLYETYTILSVTCTVVPSFPSVSWNATPQLWAIQSAESRTNFTHFLDLATQLNATLCKPLDMTTRRVDYRPYLQQNAPSPYLLTFDATTGGRQLWGGSTAATYTPLISYVQQFTSIGVTMDVAVPVVFKLVAKVHFRGRQNDIFTPAQVQQIYKPRQSAKQAKIENLPMPTLHQLHQQLPFVLPPLQLVDDSDSELSGVDSACENGA